MRTPVVAVVIPVYNRRAVIGRAIETVLAQTWADLEIIVVDDGSTDDTATVVESIGDERLRLIRHERNMGGGAARNSGINASTAPYIAFLDSDDEWLPTKLERQLAVFEQSGDRVGLVYTGSELVYADGKTGTRLPQHRGDLTQALLRKNVVGGASVSMVRRAALQATGGFDEMLPARQDIDLWLRISEHFLVDYVPEVLARIHQDGDTDRISADPATRLRARELYFEKHRGRLVSAGVVGPYLRSFGWLHQRTAGDRVVARRLYRTAVEENPFSPAAHLLMFGTYLPPRWLDTLVRVRTAATALGRRLSRLRPAGAPASSLTHQVMGGLLWTAGGKGAFVVLQLGVVLVLARLLTPTEFGVAGAALVVLQFSSIFSQLGFGPALVQRGSLEERHVRTAYTCSFLLGVALAAVVYASSSLIASFFRMPDLEPLLRAVAWIFPARGLGTVSLSLLQRERRFQWLATVEVVTYAVGYGLVATVLAWRGLGAWALVVGQLVQVAIQTALTLLARPPASLPVPDWQSFRELVYFGGGVTVSRVSSYVAANGDNLVVGRWLGAEALGLYGRAYVLMAQPARMFGLILDQVLFPVLSGVQADTRRLAAGFRRGVALVASLILPVSVAFTVFAPELVNLLLGPGWSGVVLPFRVLALAMLFRASHPVSDSLSRAVGAVYERAWRHTAYALLVLVGSWIGQHWGLTGVALAIAGALAVNFLLMAQLTLKLTSMTWSDFAQAHYPSLAGAALFAASTCGLRLVGELIGLSGTGLMVFAGGTAVVLQVLMIRAAPRRLLGAEGLWMLDLLRPRMSRAMQAARSVGV